jgi:predicted HAD superfamily phosphohydrolase YqeG
MNKVRISAETVNILKHQTESMELKNIITELKNTLVEFNSRLGQAF